MTSDGPEARISQISTLWAEVLRAHEGPPDEAREAQRLLLQRYAAPIYRYLRGALRDPDAADEAFQDFTLRFVQGDFRRANPERGRFRAFLKTVLYHLVIDHQRRSRRQPSTLTIDPAASPEITQIEADLRFTAALREELMSLAWEALANLERQTGDPLHTILRARTEFPDLRSHELANWLVGRLGKNVSPQWFRKRLSEARAKYADLLLLEVARSLPETATVADLEDELIDLKLIEYCRDALSRWRKNAPLS